jgi:hypothetical protein
MLLLLLRMHRSFRPSGWSRYLSLKKDITQKTQANTLGLH